VKLDLEKTFNDSEKESMSYQRIENSIIRTLPEYLRIVSPETRNEIYLAKFVTLTARGKQPKQKNRRQPARAVERDIGERADALRRKALPNFVRRRDY
jgi:hypothetical protein